MANAQIGNYVFEIDPYSARWSYYLNTASFDTYGGRVNQILSCKVDNLQINGMLTQRGTSLNQWARMQEFEQDMKAIMETEAETKESIAFNYPTLSWSGQVFLNGYSNVHYDAKTAAIKYTLSFTVDSGFDTIKTAASSEGLDLIPDGVNYSYNQYNTSTSSSWATVKEALTAALKVAGTDTSTSSLYTFINYIETAKSTDTTTDPTTYTGGAGKAWQEAYSTGTSSLDENNYNAAIKNPILDNTTADYFKKWTQGK